MKFSVKNLVKVFFSLFLIFQLTGCPLLDYLMGLISKEPSVEEPLTEEPVEETIIDEPEPEEFILPEPIIEEPVIEATAEPEIEEPEPLPPPQDLIEVVEAEPDIDEEEYLRSIDNLDETESVSKTEFNEDKNAILKAIAELSVIMDTKDFKNWLNYIDPSSIEYYSNPVNLRKAEKKLPNRTIYLRNIGDYFQYVFIPSRQRSQVDEIRYISKTNIKAVQVKEDKSIVVYYYFTKIGNKWFVRLPML